MILSAEKDDTNKKAKGASAEAPQHVVQQPQPQLLSQPQLLQPQLLPQPQPLPFHPKRMMIRMMSHSVLLLLQELQNMTVPFSAQEK